MWCRYNAVNFFFQNTHNRHPIAQIAEIWGGFCQFIVSSICGLCNCRAVYMYHVYDILTYWTTLYRLLTVFAFSLTPQDWNRWYPANFMSPCNFMSPWFDIFTCPAVKILHFSGQFIKYMYLGENLARIHLSNWQFNLPQVYRAMTYVEPMNLSYISQGMAWPSHVIFTLFSHLMLPLFLYFQIESYWTYELCHGKTLRQYHEEKDTNQVSYIKKVFDRIWPIMRCFLAATKQLYEWSSPSVCPSVCPFVRLSVTRFWLCSHYLIIIKFSGVITNDRSDVHAKGQGQRSTPNLAISGL